MADLRTLKGSEYDCADLVLCKRYGQRPDSEPDHASAEREPFAESISHHPAKTTYQRESRPEHKISALPSKQKESAKGQGIGRD